MLIWCSCVYDLIIVIKLDWGLVVVIHYFNGKGNNDDTDGFGNDSNDENELLMSENDIDK